MNLFQSSVRKPVLRKEFFFNKKDVKVDKLLRIVLKLETKEFVCETKLE